jgi:hypothetical protein
MRRTISWTDGRTDRSKTVYPPPPSGSGGIKKSIIQRTFITVSYNNVFFGFYTHWTYMHIFRHIFLSNYWWQKSDIWSQASFRYPISWEAFLDPSDSYFLFADGSKNATHNMVYLYDACDQISDFCHQQLLRKISWTDGRTDRSKTVYPPPPSGSGGIKKSIIVKIYPEMTSQ